MEGGRCNAKYPLQFALPSLKGCQNYKQPILQKKISNFAQLTQLFFKNLAAPENN